MTEINFLAIETYEDGCEKSTWRNFHENGHLHICVCGKLANHDGSKSFSENVAVRTIPTKTKKHKTRTEKK